MIADGPPTTANEGGLRYEDEAGFIRCPWHLWEFDIPTGACLVDATVRVKTYPVTVEDGQVIVSYEECWASARARRADRRCCPCAKGSPDDDLMGCPTALSTPAARLTNGGRPPTPTITRSA